jgi:hypothetical protein
VGRTDRRDFPFYNGLPAALSVSGGVAILAGCTAGFAILLAAHHLIQYETGRWLGSAALVLLPIGALVLAVGPCWTSFFRRPTLRDVLLALAFVPLTIVLQIVVAIPLFLAKMGVANPLFSVVAGAKGIGIADVLARTVLQIFGEELVCILPFIVFLSSLASAQMSRRQAVILAWLASSALFGLLHLPTYSWHLAQALVIIGSGRLVLTASYIATKSIWASFVTHLAADWLLLGTVALLHRH